MWWLHYVHFKFLSDSAVVENYQNIQECLSSRVIRGSLWFPFVFSSRLYVTAPISPGSCRAYLQPYVVGRRPYPTPDATKPARAPHPWRSADNEPAQQRSLAFQSCPAASAAGSDFSLQNAGPGPAPPRNAAARSPGEKDVAWHAAAAAATAAAAAAAPAAAAAAAGPC